MGNQEFLQNLGIMVISAAVIALLARQIRVPTIVAYLVAGLLVGPLTGLVPDTNATDLITETGIVLLLFLVGLELTFEKIRGVGKVALLAGSTQVLLTALGGAGLCVLLGYGGPSAWILGFALAFSSTVVAVKMLVARGENHTVFGQIAVGVLLVQDIVVVLLLTILSALGDESGAASLVMGLAKALGGMVGLLVMVLVVARWLLPRPLAWASRSSETLFILSLCWCFVVVMATHVLHLSHEIGAFIAGVSLAQLPYSHDLQRRVQPLINFFVAVFFVTLGVGMDFQGGAAFWVHALLLSAFVLLGKFALLASIVLRLGYQAKTAFFSAIMLSQISEFSFILAAVASGAGLLDAEAASLLGLVGLITISVSSLLMVYKESLFDAIVSAGWVKTESGEEPDAARGGQRRDHTIIVGGNTLGRELARRLAAAGEQVLVIDVDPEKLEGLPCEVLLGDAGMMSVLKESDYESARLLISTLHIAPVNELLAFRCKTAGTKCSIHAFDLRSMNQLLEMDVAYLIVPKVDGIKRQNAVLKEIGVLAKS